MDKRDKIFPVMLVLRHLVHYVITSLITRQSLSRPRRAPRLMSSMSEEKAAVSDTSSDKFSCSNSISAVGRFPVC